MLLLTETGNPTLCLRSINPHFANNELLQKEPKWSSVTLFSDAILEQLERLEVGGTSDAIDINKTTADTVAGLFTTAGVTLTYEGHQFLQHARNIEAAAKPSA